MEHIAIPHPQPLPDTNVEAGEAGPTPEETERELKLALADDELPLTQLMLWKLQNELKKEKKTQTGNRK